eukprot:CAMPEP_0196184064 /NCGR_PEP_ID=MMETSP0911-20130528/33092_1 /TAXON_ID=49265 /ORGANISM="Thalassiosira rotula, Strain GSO102" /LENGTH=42 /DNA_ID= /DNA_START= /DNA_END= /DNA_ORIENTATION=
MSFRGMPASIKARVDALIAASNLPPSSARTITVTEILLFGYK